MPGAPASTGFLGDWDEPNDSDLSLSHGLSHETSLPLPPWHEEEEAFD